MLTIMTAHEAHIQTYRDWISQIMVQQGIATVSELAREAGLAESTLTRIMNPDGPGNIPREGTIAKIEQAFRTRRPITRPHVASGAMPKDNGDHSDPRLRARAAIERITNAVANDDTETEAFLVADRALDLAGYLPEDLILVDTARPPESSDVVAIRFRVGAARGAAVTLRIFDTPFLTAHSTDDTLRRPILMDPDRIEVIGVVMTAMRQRRFG